MPSAGSPFTPYLPRWQPEAPCPRVTVTAEDVLTLFGADFLGSHMGVAADAALLHLTGVLVAQHFRYGLSAYGPASSITLASGQRVQVRPADQAVRGKVGGEPWESKASWYDPGLHNANFVVLDLSNPNEQGFTYTHVVVTFGPPARTYRTGTDLVLVWHKNLLAGLRYGYVEGRPTAAGTSSQMTRCR
jgi:hypothetical protein